MFVIKILNSKIGETIAETLVATLIAALSMVMFAGMVMASKKIVENSNKKIVEYYEGFHQLISNVDANETIIELPDGLHHLIVYTNKNGVMYYDYEMTGSPAEIEESGD